MVNELWDEQSILPNLVNSTESSALLWFAATYLQGASDDLCSKEVHSMLARSDWLTMDLFFPFSDVYIHLLDPTAFQTLAQAFGLSQMQLQMVLSWRSQFLMTTGVPAAYQTFNVTSLGDLFYLQWYVSMKLA